MDAVARLAVTGSLDDELAVAALRFLGEHHDHPSAVGRLEALLRRGRQIERRVAIEELARRGHASIVPELKKMAATADPKTAAVIAGALGVLGDHRCETTLLRLLRAEDETVQEAAAGALGMVGTARAVGPLLKLTEGLIGSGELTRTAARAVVSIQERVGKGDEGGLSLAAAGGEQGDLTLAEEEGGKGEISLAERGFETQDDT